MRCRSSHARRRVGKRLRATRFVSVNGESRAPPSGLVSNCNETDLSSTRLDWSLVFCVGLELTAGRLRRKSSGCYLVRFETLRSLALLLDWFQGGGSVNPQIVPLEVGTYLSNSRKLVRKLAATTLA